MKLFQLLQEHFLGTSAYNSFFYWRNIVEVLFFTLLIYYFSLWLKKDRQKNLLPHFYGYCLLSLLAHATQLTTLSYFLFLFSPVAIMLFILVHQEVLQRNFVALRNIIPAKRDLSSWPEILIRSCLIAINNNKKVLCALENKDSIAQFLDSPLILNSNIKEELIKILQESNFFNENKMLWVNTQGKVIGVNASFKDDNLQEFFLPDTKNISKWKQNALFLSSKTDTLFLRITPTDRTFDIIFNGKIINNVKANNALNIIRKYACPKISQKQSSLAKGDLIHEANTKKNLFKQRTN